jgi:hypothetical protein
LQDAHVGSGRRRERGEEREVQKDSEPHVELIQKSEPQS